MSSSQSPWSPPEPPVQPASGASGLSYTDGSPLGGVAPVETVVEPTSDRRELVLTALLLISALVAGAASLMAWRDFGQRFGSTAVETGWVRPDDSMGRGWLVVVLAVLIAVAGVLIAAERVRAGRILAVLAGTGLALVSVLEWGLGAGDVRSGPGLGLWVELAVGVFVVIAVGVLTPADTEDTASG